MDPYILVSYADFLNYALEKYDKAEEFYKKAIEIAPSYTTAIGNYAIFLENRREDFGKAEEFYKRSIDSDSNDANILGNYAHFLMKVKNDFEEAENYINLAFEQEPTRLFLVAELWFYRYAHYEEYYEEAEEELEKLIDKGAKSPGWDLQSHVDIARKNGHPNPEKLRKFADAITEPED